MLARLRFLNSIIFVLVMLLTETATSGDHPPVQNQDIERAQMPGGESSSSFEQEIIDITLPDNEQLSGRLCLPEQDNPQAVPNLIIFVHGTGPATYLTKRQIRNRTFNFFDFFAEEFCKQGNAFFTYNKRGCTIGEEGPLFDEVDRDKFRKVVPSTEVQDLASIIGTLKNDERLANARVVLYGHSEGTAIAALAAEKHPDLVDVLFLSGYAHENMYDIMVWQLSGYGSMLAINPVFDSNDDKKISQEEYESDDAKVTRYREREFKNAGFVFLDANKDGLLDEADFAMRNKPMLDFIMKCVAEGNEDWIWNNYFRISIPWLREHFSLEANKTRLTRLDIPIYIFHGADDPNVDVNNVYKLEKRFNALAKTNLQPFVFEKHNHDLNFLDWALKDEMPEGLAKVFEVASSLGAKPQDR